jgi:opacity protein-like surface antigen
MRSLSQSLLIILILFGAAPLFSQGLYISAGGGWNFSTSARQITFNATPSGDNTKYEGVHGTFGRGGNAGVSIGYDYSQNLGLDLNFSYLFGAKTTGESSYSSGKYSDLNTETLSARMLRINPRLVISHPCGRVEPYVQFGAVFGKGKVTYEEEWTSTNTDPWEGGTTTNTGYDKWEYSGGWGIGVSGAIGANLKLSDNMSIFGEINTINMAYAPKMAHRLESTFNGQDQLPDFSTSQKEIEFVESYTSGSGSENEPDEDLKIYMPFGSVGINAGIKINFTGGSEEGVPLAD